MGLVFFFFFLQEKILESSKSSQENWEFSRSRAPVIQLLTYRPGLPPGGAPSWG